jgi:plastocyanin
VRRPPLPESLVALAAVGLFALAAVGFAQAGGPTVDVPAAEPGGTEVAIAEFAFGPSELTVSVGDTVTWTNLDSAAHTATVSGGGPIDSGNLEQDDTYDHTFEEGGSFSYICVYHPFMTGTITVEP